MLAKLLITFARGFGMGAADVVPGVSGGTIALLVGIYEQLLDNVRRGARAVGSLVKADPKGFVHHLRSIEWLFILPLAAGLGTAVVGLASVVEGLLDSHPEEMAGLFFGLVAGSIVVSWQLVRRPSVLGYGLMVLTSVVTFVGLGFQSGPVADPSLLAFFGAGAIAICAMILPGISGSFLLLMMGMYATVLGAVHDRSGSDLVSLGIFLLGAVIGLALFSSALGWLLDRHHDLILAGLIGLMVGSFRVLWPWPNGVGVISDVPGESVPGTGLEWPAAGDLWAPTLLAVASLALVVGLTWLAGGNAGMHSGAQVEPSDGDVAPEPVRHPSS